jgi:hypothetical protein
MPTVTIPSKLYAAIHATYLLSGKDYLSKMCITDALAIIKGILDFPGIDTAPTNNTVASYEDQPESISGCMDPSSIDMDEGDYQSGSVDCPLGLSLHWVDSDTVYNNCCRPETGGWGMNLIQKNKPCTGYNTLKLANDFEIRFKPINI